MKTKEELNAIKNEVETVSRKLAELTDEELTQVSGGGDYQTQALLEMSLFLQFIDILNSGEFEKAKSFYFDLVNSGYLLHGNDTFQATYYEYTGSYM